MQLQIPNELDGVVLLDDIKFLLEKYNELDEALDADDSDNNLKEEISLCKTTYINLYIKNVIEMIILGSDDYEVCTDDDVSYLMTMITSLKDSPIFLEFFSLLNNISIPNRAFNGRPGWTYTKDEENGVMLTVNIDKVKTYQLSYLIEQLIKSILSMVFTGKIKINIDNATSIIYTNGESVLSQPNVQLSSRYDFGITSLSELVSGSY